MESELINPFVHSTVNVVNTMTASNIIPQAPYIKQDRKTWGILTGVIGMASDQYSGNMLISFDEKCILGLISKMLMEEFTQISDEIIDAVGELTNMIVGGAKKEFSEKGLVFNMATPVMISGKNVELSQLGKGECIGVQFDTDWGPFVVEASLSPARART